MKTILGYIGSWVLYGLGDLVSKPMHYLDWAWLYPTYNRLMLWSCNLQEWGNGCGPWQDPDDE